MLRRPFHGRGYATEAARALRPLVPGRVVSLIRIENDASRNVAQKIGMTRRTRDRVRGLSNTRVLERLALTGLLWTRCSRFFAVPGTRRVTTRHRQ